MNLRCEFPGQLGTTNATKLRWREPDTSGLENGSLMPNFCERPDNPSQSFHASSTSHGIVDKGTQLNQVRDGSVLMISDGTQYPRWRLAGPKFLVHLFNRSPGKCPKEARRRDADGRKMTFWGRPGKLCNTSRMCFKSRRKFVGASREELRLTLRTEA